MRRRAVTLKEVARQAGVSAATVSAVLSASSSNNIRVSDATRQHIVEVAQRIQYQPNAMAQSLQRRHTNIIGFYGGPDFLLNAHHPVSAAMLGGLQVGCAERSKNLLLYGAFQRKIEEDHQREDRIVGEIANGHVDGLVVWTASDDPIVRKLSSFGLPIVAMVDSIPGIPSVIADDAGGAGRLVEYLAGQGHERLAFCPDGGQSTSVVQRRRAFEEAAANLGLSFWECPPIRYDTQAGDYSISQKAFDWLEQPRDRRPTAVAGAFDEIAFIFMAHCLQKHYRMPQDLAVVGFDGVERARLGAPRLTTIRSPWEAVGQKAVTVLSDLLQGNDVLMETVMPVDLIIGGTA